MTAQAGRNNDNRGAPGQPMFLQGQEQYSPTLRTWSYRSNRLGAM